MTARPGRYDSACLMGGTVLVARGFLLDWSAPKT